MYEIWSMWKTYTTFLTSLVLFSIIFFLLLQLDCKILIDFSRLRLNHQGIFIYTRMRSRAHLIGKYQNLHFRNELFLFYYKYIRGELGYVTVSSVRSVWVFNELRQKRERETNFHSIWSREKVLRSNLFISISFFLVYMCTRKTRNFYCWF